MKKILAIFLTAVMMTAFCAFAETDNTAADIEAVDITADGMNDETEAEESENNLIDAEPAEASDSVTLGFEEGFAIELPAGWLHYTVTEEMAVDGVVYCLSDAAGECWLYIQEWQSDCSDADALLELVNNVASPLNSGKYNFNGTDFVVYDLETSDVSCCATLMDGKILNFVFTPQSNADFMVTAAQVIGTFTVL